VSNYQGLTAAERQQQYRLDRELVKNAKRTQVKFLGSALNLRMGVTVIGGCTGKGKSTASANIIADFYTRYPDRQALVITNEEVSSDVLDRASCALLKEDFYAYREGEVGPLIEEKIEKLSSELFERVEIVSTSSVDMTCLEDVIDVLTYAAGKKEINLVLLDYLQTVSWSKENKELNAYAVSKKLGLFLKDYGRKVDIPIVMFAQIQPLPGEQKEDGWVPDFSGRIQGDKTFSNHCVMTIEIIPNFETRITRFYIHKDRFGNNAGKSFNFEWVQGRLVEKETF